MESNQRDRLKKELDSVLATPELPELSQGQRPGLKTREKIEEALEHLFKDYPVRPVPARLIRGACYLWHEHWTEAHQIAQEIETAEGSFLHAILHRREPDFGNANYWFRRIPHHACFREIGKRVETLLGSSNPTLLDQLVSDGTWKPSAFVDACAREAERKSPSSDDSHHKILQEIQKIEFDSFLSHLLNG